MNYYPSTTDKMWNEENKYTIGYCYGLGLDVGCGNRTLMPNMITVDNWADGADYKMEADNLHEFKDKMFDFVYASHVLEHLKSPLEAIEEWLRVVKVGGYVIIITPDMLYVPTKGMANGDPQHKYDWKREEVREMVGMLSGCEMVNKNVWALPNYSMLFVLRRTK